MDQPKEQLVKDSDDGAARGSFLGRSAGQSTRLGPVAGYDCSLMSMPKTVGNSACAAVIFTGANTVSTRDVPIRS